MKTVHWHWWAVTVNKDTRQGHRPLFASTSNATAATATRIISCSSKIQHGLPFWCRLTQVVLEKRPLNGCSSSSVIY